MTEDRKARREAIRKCKGHLSARAVAAQFDTTIAAVKGIWYDFRRPTRKPTKWRCQCGAMATGASCLHGHAAPWVMDDQMLREQIDHLPPESDEWDEA